MAFPFRLSGCSGELRPFIAALLDAHIVRVPPQLNVWVLGRAVSQLSRELGICLPSPPVASFIAVTVASLPQLSAVQVRLRAGWCGSRL